MELDRRTFAALEQRLEEIKREIKAILADNPCREQVIPVYRALLEESIELHRKLEHEDPA